MWDFLENVKRFVMINKKKSVFQGVDETYLNLHVGVVKNAFFPCIVFNPITTQSTLLRRQINVGYLLRSHLTIEIALVYCLLAKD